MVLSSKLSSQDPNCDSPLALAINVGDSTGGDAGMIVNFDNLQIDFAYPEGPSTTTFNFVAVE